MTSPTVRIAALALAILGLSAFAFAVPALADAEPNDSFAQAEPVAGGSHAGVLGCPTGQCQTWDYEDVYSFAVTRGKTVDLTLASEYETNVNVYDAAQDQVPGSFTKTTHALSWVAENPPYYVRIAESTAIQSLNYTLALSVRDTPGTPSGDFLSGSVLGVPTWVLLLIIVLVVVVAVVVGASRRRR